MAPAVDRKHWTVADYMALPGDGKRYEVIDGDLFVTPAPTWDHQRLVGRLQRAGVGEYWIVDGEARVVERWRPADARPEIISEELAWHPDPAHAPLRIALPEFFTGALGE